MATLIYEEQAGDKLKLLAEVGEDNVELAVDALLDAEPKLASKVPFICFSTDARIVVEEIGEEIVQPRRKMKISGNSNGGTKSAGSRTRTKQPEPQTEEGEVETNPKPASKTPAKRGSTRKTGSTRKPAAKKPASKPAAKRGSTAKKPAAKSGGGSPFKRNPKSDE